MYTNDNETAKKPGNCVLTTAPTRVSIKEANDHLQLLHRRVEELEESIKIQVDKQRVSEDMYKAQLKELKQAKESQIEELSRTIVKLEERIKDLESEIKEKNVKLENSQRRLNLLDVFIVNSIPTLQNLIYGLKNLSIDSNILNKDELNVEGRASSGIGVLFESNGSVSDITSVPGISTPSGTSGNSTCDDSGFYLVSDMKQAKNEQCMNNAKESADKMETESQRGRSKHQFSETNKARLQSRQLPKSKYQSKSGKKVVLVQNSNSCYSQESSELSFENNYGSKSHIGVGRSFSIISNFSEDEELPSNLPSTKQSTEVHL